MMMLVCRESSPRFATLSSLRRESSGIPEESRDQAPQQWFAGGDKS